MPQLYHQASQQGIWTVVGPPQSCAVQLAQPLTITYGDGTTDSLAAHVPAVTAASTTQVDRTRAVWVVYVSQSDPTLRIVREQDLPTLNGAYSPLARVLADRVVPYQPEQGLAQSTTGGEWFLPLVITNGASSSIGGSTTTPVASTSTDYVVQCHLTGTTASAVWNALGDKTSFTDLQVLFAGAELDADVDQQTNGLWSSSNITLWFRLQRPIAASASDQGYQLRMGGPARSSPPRSWDNIYPFWDDFRSSSLDASKWTVAGSASVSVSGGVLILQAANNAGTAYGVVAKTSFGPGYETRARLSIGAISNHSIGLRLLTSSSSIANPQDVFNAFWSVSTSQWYVDSSTGSGQPLLGTVDTSQHSLTLARAADGTLHASFDGGADTTRAATLTGALYPCLSVLSQDSSTAQSQTDWLRVRPWVTIEPTVTAGTLQSAAPLRWEPVVDSTGSVLIAPGGDPIMALTAGS